MATQASVAASLRKKGFAMTITRTTPGAYDPVTGFGLGVIETFTVYSLLGNYGILDRAQSANAAGTVIQIGDKKATVEAGVVVPVPGDTVTINNADWGVVAVDAVNPQGVDLMYKLQIRK